VQVLDSGDVVLTVVKMKSRAKPEVSTIAKLSEQTVAQVVAAVAEVPADGKN